MRYLSVCSGIEAASVAWKPLGWQCAGVSDIEPFPRAVLQHRLGAVPVDWDHRYDPSSNILPLFGDFTKIQEYHVGPVQLLIGGTPCQSFSIAGKRLGLDDPRGNLAIEFLALARRLRVPWIVWENVPGVLSSWSGDAPDCPDMGAEPKRTKWSAEYDETGDFHAFLDLFRECGYRGCYRVLDAQYVRVAGLERAVPQRRRRVFVVGHLGDDCRAIPVLFDPGSMRGDPAPRRRKGQGFAHDTSSSLVGSVRGVERAGETRGQDPVIAERLGFGGNNTAGPIDVATAVRAHGTQHGDFESETFIGEAITFPAFMSGTAEVSEHDTSNTVQSKNPVAVAFTCKDSGQDATEDASPTLRSMAGAPGGANAGGQVAVAYAMQAGITRQNVSSGPDGMGVQEEVAYTVEARREVQSVSFTVSENSNGFAWEGEVAPAVQTNIPNPEANTFSGVVEEWRVRRLLPRECERLQGFPDDWTLIPYGPRTPVDPETFAYLKATYPVLTEENAALLAADAPRYKAVGNSFPVNVIRWIGTRIALIDQHFGA